MIRAATPADPLRVAVLASGGGTNLQALLDRLPGGRARIVCVAASRPEAGALARAAAAGVPAAVFALADHDGDGAARDARLADWLAGHHAELVVLAGWLGVCTAALLDRLPLVNVHPSLLPAFPGAHAVADALAHGARVTGVTVHLVDQGVDTGPILLQEAVAVHYDDEAASLLERLHAVEHRLLPVAVELLAADRVEVEGRQVRVVPWEGV